jgi:hypothetical protein
MEKRFSTPYIEAHLEPKSNKGSEKKKEVTDIPDSFVVRPMFPTLEEYFKDHRKRKESFIIFPEERVNFLPLAVAEKIKDNPGSESSIRERYITERDERMAQFGTTKSQAHFERTEQGLNDTTVHMTYGLFRNTRGNFVKPLPDDGRVSPTDVYHVWDKVIGNPYMLTLGNHRQRQEIRNTSVIDWEKRSPEAASIQDEVFKFTNVNESVHRLSDFIIVDDSGVELFDMQKIIEYVIRKEVGNNETEDIRTKVNIYFPAIDQQELPKGYKDFPATSQVVREEAAFYALKEGVKPSGGFIIPEEDRCLIKQHNIFLFQNITDVRTLISTLGELAKIDTELHGNPADEPWIRFFRYRGDKSELSEEDQKRDMYDLYTTASEVYLRTIRNQIAFVSIALKPLIKAGILDRAAVNACMREHSTKKLSDIIRGLQEHSFIKSVGLQFLSKFMTISGERQKERKRKAVQEAGKRNQELAVTWEKLRVNSGLPPSDKFDKNDSGE